MAWRYTKIKVLIWSTSFPDLNLIEHLWDIMETKCEHGGPTHNFSGFRIYYWGPGTTAYNQTSVGVHVLSGQNC